MLVTWDVDPRHYKQREDEVGTHGFYSHTPPPSYREACEGEDSAQRYQEDNRFHFIDVQPIDEESRKTTQKDLTALGGEETSRQRRTCCDALLHLLGF